MISGFPRRQVPLSTPGPSTRSQGRHWSQTVFRRVAVAVHKYNFYEVVFQESVEVRVYNQPRVLKSNRVSLTGSSRGIGFNPRIFLSFSLSNTPS